MTAALSDEAKDNHQFSCTVSTLEFAAKEFSHFIDVDSTE